MVGRPASSELPALTHAHLGPISVTHASIVWVRIIGVAIVTMMMSLMGLLLYLWMKVRNPQATVDREGPA